VRQVAGPPDRGLSSAQRLRRVGDAGTRAVRLPVGLLGTDVHRRRVMWAEMGSCRPVPSAVVSSELTEAHLTLLHVVHGVVAVALAGEEFSVPEGAGLIGCWSDGDRVDSRDGSQIVTVSVPLRLVPSYTRGEVPSSDPLPLPPSSSLRASGAFVLALLEGGRTGPTQAVAEANAITGMIAAMIADAAVPPSFNPAEAPTGATVKAFIDSRLLDRDLTANSIAAAFGVSRRTVYNVLQTERITVARYVQSQRLERVASCVTSGSPLSQTELVRHFGFASRDQLIRAFRVRYGMNIAEYRQEHAERSVVAMRPRPQV
jgi:AraC-like DNA-binding protein